MWTRRELKERGKTAFRANYWRCVLVALVLVLITGGVSGFSGYRSGHQISQSQSQKDPLSVDVEGLDPEAKAELDESLEELSQAFNALSEEDKDAVVGTVATVILGVIAVICTVSFILSILVFNPLQVGCQRFFSENSKDMADLNEMGFGFGRGGYGRVVKTMLLNDIFLLLWTLLFIIPGFVKSYSYRMVPFILAQEPELSGREAITRSREMMNGHKWNTFVLDLSFILWILLTIITLGIVGVFYFNPYYYATNAELYYALSGKGGSVKTDPELY